MLDKPISIVAERTAKRPPEHRLPELLLAWYDANHRELPWRVGPRDLAAGARPEPYRVWLSEIMLQQTTVQAVKPYFESFLQRWPDVGSLARADAEDVMKAWAGLGYYSRARNLKACAEAIAERNGGVFPDTENGLRQLPGIGAYTAAAIAAIAFGRRAVVVDGNVERVTARLFALDMPPPEAKRRIRELLEAIAPDSRPGDFAQGMMDLGATICSPRQPRCRLCPLLEICAAAPDDPERFPVRAAKTARPTRRGAVFVAIDEQGAVLVRRRPNSGLLGGMTEVPTSAWTARVDGDVTVAAAPFSGEWRPMGIVRHVFTHFSLELAVWRADIVRGAATHGMRWSDDIAAEALPSIMRKVIGQAAPELTAGTSNGRTE